LPIGKCNHQVDDTGSAADNITWAKVFEEIADHLLKPVSFWEPVTDDRFDVYQRLISQKSKR